MPGKFTLGKNERLKRRKIIDQLFSEGKHINVFPLSVRYLYTKLPDSFLQAGFVAGSRQFKKAVDRNRIRRLLREAYRLQKETLQKKLQEKNLHLALFFVYTGKELPDYALVSEKMGVILKRLIKVVDETGHQ